MRSKLSTFSCIRFQIPSCWVIRAGRHQHVDSRALLEREGWIKRPLLQIRPLWVKCWRAASILSLSLHFLLYLSISSSHSLPLSLTQSCFWSANSPKNIVHQVPLEILTSFNTSYWELFGKVALWRITITVNHRKVNPIGIWDNNKKKMISKWTFSVWTTGTLF